MDDTMRVTMPDVAELGQGLARQDDVPPQAMPEQTIIGLGILGAALGLGLLGDLLLRSLPWGINVFLWIGTLILSVVGLLEWRGREARGGGRWLALPLLFFAAALAWRASGTLQFLDILALLVLLGLAAAHTRAGQLRVAGLMEYAWALVQSGIHAAFGPLMLAFSTIQWKLIPRGRWTGQAIAIGRGLLITVPLLFLFGGLFMAADAVFEGIITDIFHIEVDEIIVHLFLFGFWSWLAAGFLRQTLLEKEPMDPALERPSFARLGVIEVGIVMGMLDLLFLAFVLVQFRYFFGGAALVETSIGMSYAEYARRGFFELVTVGALVLPMLLVIHWLFRAERVAHERLFRGMAAVMIVLLYVIMASAVQRMRLYQSEFGMTELRLYTTVFMGWLALVFAWFSATVLRGQRDRFAFGALATGLVTIALLHALNPDAFIVQTNVGRKQAPQPFDREYVTTLSADAVPTLIATLPQMEQEDRCQVAAIILRDWTPPERVDWRTWNWGRAQAWQAVRANQGKLQTEACELPMRSFYD